jgi:3-methyladenine DNA glycosylase/8-oxoguanine DNA glycosylase
VLARLLDENGEPDSWRLDGDHYAALVRSIVGQQLSTRAARAIYARILERFGGHPPTTQQILDDDPDELRVAVGLSHAKVRYLRSLAEHVVSGDLDLARLEDLSDEEVMTRLVAVKGIGEWSAHMFLMFQLGRPDVLAVGDLGIRRAAERAPMGCPGYRRPPPSTRSPSPGGRTAPPGAWSCGTRWATPRPEEGTTACGGSASGPAAPVSFAASHSVVSRRAGLR